MGERLRGNSKNKKVRGEKGNKAKSMTLFKTSPVRSPCKIYRESIKKFILYRQSVQYVLKKFYKYISSKHFFKFLSVATTLTLSATGNASSVM
jgi:hypothetical protein